ncbi:hypothetical protein ACOSP7_025965 [Xanthoceras sorbifolium]
MAVGSRYWASVRVITGTILGGILGFYVMHRLEISYKCKRMSEDLGFECCCCIGAMAPNQEPSRCPFCVLFHMI